MRLAILGDTHVPTREPDVPTWVRDEMAAADHTIFTGDFDTEAAYEAVVDAAGDALTAVRGNMDPVALDLPDVATEEFGGVTFVVTHGTGPPATWESRVADEVDTHGGAGAVGIAGHIHQVVDTTAGGHRILNPGSATGADPASRATLMRAEVADGDLSVEVLEPPE